VYTHSINTCICCVSIASNFLEYEGAVRLNGSYASSGRLEVFLNNQWGTACSFNNIFPLTAANVACKQLGYIQATTISFRYSICTYCM